MKKRLLLLSFIEGGTVMTAELCGARQLSPLFGSSLYVWATVMGITLGALASGYFYGAWLSEKKSSGYGILFKVLISASVFVLIMPFLGHYILPRLSYLPFIVGIVSSSLVLLFFPVFFLGATSPLFIQVQTSEKLSAGKASGIVYAVSTAGGIFATFVCGFFLIPEWGLNISIIIFGSLLFVCTVVFLKVIRPAHLLLFLGISYFNITNLLPAKNILSAEEGLLGLMEVLDIENGEKTVRVLRLNNIVQTEMDLKTKRSVSAYSSVLEQEIPKAVAGQKALVLGLGGGLLANMLAEKKYEVTGVEFDERITKAAQDFFFLSQEVKCINSDARYFLNNCTEKFKVIVFDIFKAEEQPSHVLTSESLFRLKSNLEDSAVFYINWHGYRSGQIAGGTDILLNTLHASGFETKIRATGIHEDHSNQIIICRLENKSQSLTGPDLMINTDDLQRMEKYNARANQQWRYNYLRYYQGLK